MSKIEDLVIFKNEKELSETEKSIEKIFGISFQSYVRRLEIGLDAEGLSHDDDSAVAHILADMGKKDSILWIFSLCCEDSREAAKILYANTIGCVLASLNYLSAQQVKSVDAPEWACLQACIDETSDADIFVIATTNDTRYMPQSLLRPGRFDYILNLNPPLGKTAENIVSYYLRDKNLAKDVQISDIVKAMPQVSCATLETVMNLAAINSVYRDHAHVQKEDIIDALLKVVYNLRKADCEEDPQEHQMIAVHEAAHAVVGEVLHSGSIGIITIRGSHGAIGGMESGFAVYAKSEEEFQDEIIKTLAGKAGTALIYGIMDIRAVADIKKADQLLDIWLCHFAGGGFSGVEPSENRLSEPRLSYNEAIKSAKLEELYRRAYKILYDNRDFLLAVQKELLEHETLLNSDLAKIRESCT